MKKENNKSEQAINFALDSQKYIEECQKKHRKVSNIEDDTSRPLVTARDIFGDSATYIDNTK